MKPLRKRFWWPFTQHFYSICSAHYYSQQDCPACQAGQWRSDVFYAVGHYFHDNHHKFWLWYSNSWLWRWWFNRFMRKHFPNWEKQNVDTNNSNL